MESQAKPIYVVGDKVKVVNYGHRIWENRGGDKIVFDIAPQIVGKIGIINKVESTQGIHGYSIDGIKGKVAWYNDDQLEMVQANPNRK
jgi:hypothetical protein